MYERLGSRSAHIEMSTNSGTVADSSLETSWQLIVMYHFDLRVVRVPFSFSAVHMHSIYLFIYFLEFICCMGYMFAIWFCAVSVLSSTYKCSVYCSHSRSLSLPHTHRLGLCGTHALKTPTFILYFGFIVCCVGASIARRILILI